MSRIFTKDSRGRRQPLMSTPKVGKSKVFLDDSYQDTNKKKRKAGRTYATTVQQAKKRKRAPSTPSESSASSSDAEDEASEDDDESDEDDEEPLENAPSLNPFVAEAGLSFPITHFDDAVSEAGSVGSMFDPNFQFAEGDPDLFPIEDMNNKVFAESDDDEAYKAVDDISDSDDDDVEAYEEQQLLSMLSDNEVGEGEFLNQIDGLSEYGFGDESDGTAQFPPSSQGSDTEPVHQRHVRFDIDAAHALQANLSSSPTISRALLPSAMPEHRGIFGGPASASAQAPQEPTSEEPYDSDATDDDLPAEAVIQAAAEKEVEVKEEVEESLPAPKTSVKKPQRKGPPRGVFIDDGIKASGILDPTGKIMLITHPHLLGEEFARRYGNSAPASPSTGFQELIDGSDAGEFQAIPEIAATADADPLLGALAAQMVDPANVGQPIGPQEAFYPAPGFELGDYMLEGADILEDDDLGEDNINIDDVIKFDDSDDSDEPTSPIYMPPKNNPSSSGFKIPSFANANITAFRNNADPNYTPFSTSHFTQLSELSTPVRRNRKRKAVDSPYSSSHYAGVTPVQRMRDPNPPSVPPTPDAISRPKRRRLTTA